MTSRKYPIFLVVINTETSLRDVCSLCGRDACVIGVGKLVTIALCERCIYLFSTVTLEASEIDIVHGKTAVETINLTVLYKILLDYFDEQELKELCFELNLDYDTIGENDNKSEKAREIVKYYRRRNAVNKLVRAINRKRPHLGREDSE